MNPITYRPVDTGVYSSVGAGDAFANTNDQRRIYVFPIIGSQYNPAIVTIEVLLLGDAEKVHAAYEQAIRTCAAISALWAADLKKRGSVVASTLGEGAMKEAA